MPSYNFFKNASAYTLNLSVFSKLIKQHYCHLLHSFFSNTCHKNEEHNPIIVLQTKIISSSSRKKSVIQLNDSRANPKR